MTEPIMQFKSHIKGKNADVGIYADRVEWTLQRGFSGKKLTAAALTGGVSLAATGFRSGRAGSEMIPIRAVSSVTTRRDGFINTIVRIVSSGSEIDFRVGHGEAPAIKELLTSLVTGTYNAGNPAPSPLAPTPAVAAPDYLQQLTQLGQLRDAGILTEGEFQAKKADLLSRM